MSRQGGRDTNVKILLYIDGWLVPCTMSLPVEIGVRGYPDVKRSLTCESFLLTAT